MSKPKKWVSSKLGRSSSSSSTPPLYASTNLGNTLTSGSAAMSATSAVPNAGTEEEQSLPSPSPPLRRFCTTGDLTPSPRPAGKSSAPLIWSEPASPGTSNAASGTTHSKTKAWEWHYKSFLSRLGPGGSHSSGGGKSSQASLTNLVTDFIEPPRLDSTTSAGSPAQLTAAATLKKRGGSLPTSLGRSLGAAATAAAPPSPRGSGRGRGSIRSRSFGSPVGRQHGPQRHQQPADAMELRRCASAESDECLLLATTAEADRKRRAREESQRRWAEEHRQEIEKGLLIPPPPFASSSGGGRVGGGGCLMDSSTSGNRRSINKFHQRREQLGKGSGRGGGTGGGGDSAVRGGSLFKSVFKHSNSKDFSSNHSMTSPGAASHTNRHNHHHVSFSRGSQSKSCDSLDSAMRRGRDVALSATAKSHRSATLLSDAKNQHWEGKYQHQQHQQHPQETQPQRRGEWQIQERGDVLRPLPTTNSFCSLVAAAEEEPPTTNIAGGVSLSLMADAVASEDGSIQNATYNGAASLSSVRSPSQSQSARSKSKEMKVAFTEFHNSSHYAKDSTSPYLGEDPSVHQNSYFASLYGPMKMGGVGGVGVAVHRSTGKLKQPTLASSLPPAPVTEDSISSPRYLKASRVLDPFQGPESWAKGRRYLIAPAILTMCPAQVLSLLSGGGSGSGGGSSAGGGDHHLPPNEITNDDDSPTGSASGEGEGNVEVPLVPHPLPMDGTAGEPSSPHLATHSLPNPSPLTHTTPSHPFGKVILGKAMVAELTSPRKHCDEINHSTCWSTGIFVLRQNYLLEYEEGDDFDGGMPRGYAHLQHSTVVPHRDFHGALQLDFYQSPCARGNKRTLMMRVPTRQERDRWVHSITQAANLTVKDLYDYDEANEFGRGRYATIYPARRRVGGLRPARPGATAEEDDKLPPRKPTPPPTSHNRYDCALKIVNKKEFWSRVQKGRERADTLVRETAVQATLSARVGSSNSNNVSPLTFLRLRSFFETCDNVIMELELLEGIDLFQYVSSNGILDEDEAARIIRDVLNCIDAMHHIGIAHRDVKLANILMCDEARDGVCVKVGDFGMATFVGVDDLVRGRCGTPGYVAPEIFAAGANSGYGNKVDVFSCGATLYVMLCGYEPFYGESDAELIAANKVADVEYPESDWGTISAEGKDLVQKMLEPNPGNRITANEALRHPWILNRAPRRRNNPPPGSSKEQQGHNSKLSNLPHYCNHDVGVDPACVIS